MLFCVVAHNSMPWIRGTANNSLKSGLVGDTMPSMGKMGKVSPGTAVAALALWLNAAALHATTLQKRPDCTISLSSSSFGFGALEVWKGLSVPTAMYTPLHGR